MIQLNNITKRYHNTYALKDVQLHIKQGELVILKGKSGSGKSTLLSLIAALTRPTSGEVIVNDDTISKLLDHFACIYRREHIGFVFQKYNLIETMSVQNNILLPLFPSNPDIESAHALVERTLVTFGLTHKRDELVKNLSGGEQQRVAIARAMINDPEIILADEPTANLDEGLSREFITILKKLKKLGKTIIIATHDSLFFDLEFVDRVVELKDGTITHDTL